MLLHMLLRIYANDNVDDNDNIHFHVSRFSNLA